MLQQLSMLPKRKSLSERRQGRQKLFPRGGITKVERLLEGCC